MSIKREISRLRNSFKVAIAGIIQTFMQEKNMQIHGVIAIGIAGISLWIDLLWWQYVVIFALIVFVWAFELMNTAIEAAFDSITKDQHPLAKKGKDAAAGAVLLVSILAVIIGFSIIWTPLMLKVHDLHAWLTMNVVSSRMLLYVCIIVWLLLMILMVSVSKKEKRPMLWNVVLFASMFSLFMMSATPWLQTLLFLFPFIMVILDRKGFRMLVVLVQVLVAQFGVYIVYSFFH